MKRTVTIILCILMLASAALAQTPAKPAEAAPTVDQIIDKYVQALGGKAAIEKATSRVSKGTFEIPAMGVSGTVEVYEKAPNKTISIVTVPGFGVINEAYNGTIAWAQDPQSGLREKSGTELADAKLDAAFYRPLKLKELFPKITVKGKEKVGDREAWVVEAAPAEGSPEKWYFDTQTGLIIRMDQERESPMGKLPIESYLENYKEVDGIKVPFTMKQNNPNFNIVVTIEDVKHNVTIDDAKFNKPSGQ